MTDLITTDLVFLDADLGDDARSVIRAFADRIVETGRATDAEALFDAAWAREQKTATGVPGGIAIPHCRSAAVTEPTLVMGRLSNPVDFGAKDGPADLVFSIAAPEGADKEHLKLLSSLARALVKKDYTARLRAAGSEEEIVSLVEEAIAPKPTAPKPATSTPEVSSAEVAAGSASPTAGAAVAGAAAGNAIADSASTDSTSTDSADSADSAAASGTGTGSGSAAKHLVAVTSCATGIAHTYMAADALSQAAEEMGVDLVVETQGSSGITPLPAATIAAADAVIFAADVDVRDKGRFAGKPVVQVPVKAGIEEPEQLIERAIAAAEDPHAARVENGGADEANAGSASGGGSLGQKIKRVLLTGVSYMIPFVAAGGLLMAIGFLLGTYEIANEGVADTLLTQNTLWNLPAADMADQFGRAPLLLYLGAVAFKIGSLSMSFLVPALAGYIAFGIADRTGIAPGFTAGAVALFMGAGFLGGLVGGVLAGLAAYWINSWKVPQWLRGLMPVVIVPLGASIFSSGLMLLVLGGPIATLMELLTNWLNGMTGTSAVVLGAILGIMMCIDLGGPVNKVAYSFAVAGLGAASMSNPAPWQIMAAVMGAGMVPPLAMALATFIDKKVFTEPERENGKAAILLGLSFISEGAIPFAAADPLRVIPASVVGGAVTGAMSMFFGVTSQAPHGGIFVAFAIDPLGWWLLSILVGTVITAILTVLLKRFARKDRGAATVPGTPVEAPAAV